MMYSIHLLIAFDASLVPFIVGNWKSSFRWQLWKSNNRGILGDKIGIFWVIRKEALTVIPLRLVLIHVTKDPAH